MSTRRRVEVTLVRDRAHYDEVVMGAVARARVSVWISTANVKGVRVEALKEMMGARPASRGLPGTQARGRRTFVSILAMFADLAARGVELRLLHAGVPSRAFREDLRKQKRLTTGGLAMRRCPRVHLKMIAVDGALLYLGSANFTGAGLGAKGDRRRNFEAGVLTDDDVLLDEMQATFDGIWSGKECPRCALRAQCPAPIDGLLAAGPTARGPARTVSSESPGPSPLRPRARSRKSGA
ncbi:Phospholipase D Active site motif domain protein [Minicystis rosea]|nr:Phospholipase D Active site motif domain protein [Minicystis rosea]